MSNPVRTRRGVGLKKVALLVASALLAINIWTGAPLLAVWVGSQVQAGSGVSITTVFAVVAVLGVLIFAFAVGLSYLSAEYDRLVGRPPERRRYPWLESMRGARPAELRRERGVNPAERATIVSVVAAVLAFEIWFFFFAGSPLPN